MKKEKEFEILFDTMDSAEMEIQVIIDGVVKYKPVYSSKEGAYIKLNGERQYVTVGENERLERIGISDDDE